jgi:lipoprotein-releasing system permease protein
VTIRRSRPRLGLLVYVALRSLVASRLTLVLLALAIAAGIGFQIPNTANLAGFGRALLEETLRHGAGDVRVEPRDRPRFLDGDTTAERLRQLSGARSAVPVLVFAGAIGVRGRFLGTPVFGIDGGSAEQPFRISEGATLARGDRTGVLVGTSLAKRLGLGVGAAIELRVIFGPAEASVTDDNLGRFTMTVRGIVGGSAGGYRNVYVDRSFLAEEAGTPKAASMIVLHLDDHDAAAATAERINASVPDVQAVGWRDDDPWLVSYLDANATINSISYAMVIAAVAIPMWALLYIHVLKRRREIGILAALGFGRREIFLIYVLQSLAVALLGCAVGAVGGYAMIGYFDGHPLFEWEGLVVRPLVAAGTFVVPALVIVATAVVAGSYPAWRAARTDPAKVLRRIE